MKKLIKFFISSNEEEEEEKEETYHDFLKITAVSRIFQYFSITEKINISFKFEDCAIFLGFSKKYFDYIVKETIPPSWLLDALVSKSVAANKNTYEGIKLPDSYTELMRTIKCTNCKDNPVLTLFSNEEIGRIEDKVKFPCFVCKECSQFLCAKNDGN